MAEDTDKLLEDLKEVMTGLKGSVEALSTATKASIEATKKSYEKRKQEATSDIKKELDSISDALAAGTIDITQANKDRREQYKKMVAEGVDKGTSAEATALREAFNSLRKELGDVVPKYSKTTETLIKGSENFAKVSGTLAKDIFNAGQGAKPLSAALAIAGAESSAFSGLIGSASPALTTFGTSLLAVPHPIAKFTGALVAGAGLIAPWAAKFLGVSNEVLQTIGKYAIAFEGDFTKASVAGATFAGGMTELRDAAGFAGVKIGDLVSGISDSQEAFARGGANFQAATRIIKGLGTSLSEGKVAVELYSLGFTDNASRISLAGDAFSRARMSGLTLEQSLKDLDSTTLQYGKDLKALQGITGKDAKAQLDKAQAERMRGALEDKMTAEQANVFDAFFASAEKTFGTAEGARLQIALSQAAAGDTITDTGIRSNQAMMQFIETFKSQLQTGADSVQAAIPGYIETVKKLGTDLKGPMGNMGRTAESASLQLKNIKSDPLIDGIASMYNAAKKGAVSITDLLNPPKEGEPSADPTTQAFAKVSISANKAQVALEQVALSQPSIVFFTTAMDLATTAIYKLINQIQKATGGGSGGEGTAGTTKASSTDATGLLLTAAAALIPGASLLTSLTSGLGGGGGGAGGAGGGAAADAGWSGFKDWFSKWAGEKADWAGSKATSALESVKGWFTALESIIPEGISSTLQKGFTVVSNFFGKVGNIATKISESSLGKSIGSGIRYLGEGFEKTKGLFAGAGEAAVAFSKSYVPLLGDAIQGIEAYRESEYTGLKAIGEGALAAGGSFVGRAVGAAGGSVAGAAVGSAVPVLGTTAGAAGGAIIGEVAGSFEGASIGSSIAKWLFGEAKKEKLATTAKTEQPNTAVGTPASTLSVTDQLKQASTFDEKQTIIKKAEKEAIDNISKLQLQIADLNAQNLKKPSLEIEKALAESEAYLKNEKDKFMALMITKATEANKEAIKPPLPAAPEKPIDEKTKKYNESLKAFKERWMPDDPQIKAQAQAKEVKTEVPQVKPATASMFDKSNAAIAAGASLKSAFDNPETAKARGVDKLDSTELTRKEIQTAREREDYIKRTGTIPIPQSVAPVNPQSGAPAIDLTASVTDNNMQKIEEAKRQSELDSMTKTQATTDNSTGQAIQSLAQEFSSMTYAFQEVVEYLRSIASNTKNTFQAVQ